VIDPELDLALSPVREPRPDPREDPAAAPSPAALGVGARLYTVTSAAQLTTLAGFLVLDSRGVIIAGRSGVGASLAHVEEVQAALEGRYASALRRRADGKGRVPLQSISRSSRVRVYVAMPTFVDDRVAGVVYLSRTPISVLEHLYQERG